MEVLVLVWGLAWELVLRMAWESAAGSVSV
jgi:hypothetical protein